LNSLFFIKKENYSSLIQEIKLYLSTKDSFPYDNNNSSLQNWKLFWEKNPNKFPIFQRLVASLYSIPYKNAEIERAFSGLKLIKNDRRLNLDHPQLEALLGLKMMNKKPKEGSKRKLDEGKEPFLSRSGFKKVKKTLRVIKDDQKESKAKRKKVLNLKDFVQNV